MSASSGGPIRILLVDDHPAVSERISELLAGVVPGAEVVSAGTGEAGLAFANTQRFDVVLLDLRLPGRSGIEVLRELRNNRPSLPVIIISSLPESPYSTLARRAGAAGFICKSSLAQELGRMVKATLHSEAMA